MNPILQRLQEEKKLKLPGGLYHEFQIRMTYNSERIEGSTLTEDQTRMIFENKTIDSKESVPVDDILETMNHFRAIDYVIDNAEVELSEEFIKKLHFILKSGTTDAEHEWFAVGEYKKRPNFVGGKKTALPSEVQSKISKLLSDYNAKTQITLEDIVDFHYFFEQIHPFQDGNGRVGRLVALKECLKHDVVPFIIEDRKKSYYYRGLSLYNEDKAYLMDTCLDGQDNVTNLLKELEVI